MIKAFKFLSITKGEKTCCEYLTKRISLKNVCFYFYFSEVLKLKKLNKASTRYIHKHFQQVAETEEFLELEYKYLTKILRSSKLNVTSELSVLNTVNSWVSHNKKSRSTFFIKLLSYVRLHLLPPFALNELKCTTAWFSKLKGFKSAVEKVEINGTLTLNSVSGNRVCSKHNKSILCIGDGGNNSASTNVFEISTSDFGKITALPSLKENQSCSVALNISGTIYVVGGLSNHLEERLIQKYTPGISECWKTIGSFPDYQQGFTVCSLLEKIYVLNGMYYGVERGYCFCFNPTAEDSIELPRMRKKRQFAASVAFQNMVLVCGGDRGKDRLRTTRLFDPEDFKWKRLPDMCHSRARHKAVASENKMFVLGGTKKFSCEMYDSVSNVFTLLTNTPATCSIVHYLQTVLIDKKIYVFRNRAKIFVYDIEGETWSKLESPLSQQIRRFFTCIEITALKLS